ncbi:DNA uptake protein [Actinobacillus minor NM305]|uniref:DNA uptake protein n=1 Tax=Actinobacillus minor NM305 TaxID=637911 RepID=C5S429_9PAST|nr:helix-hairpin-helix domain-containing protein [Actinobacillus minor]EER46351.1 DNA uptake protein [Actinobacillus minor NM305]MDY5107547.1 helix-hairpin-helix domain-containing protein [Actinobacillus minor]
MKKMNVLAVTLGLLSGTAFAQQPQPVEQPSQTQNPAVMQQSTIQQATNTIASVPANTTQQIQQVANPNLVNINVASAAEIQDKLVGIGAKKAQAIVDYRTKNGAFSSIEQLKEVSGIGSATLDKNRERIILQ